MVSRSGSKRFTCFGSFSPLHSLIRQVRSCYCPILQMRKQRLRGVKLVRGHTARRPGIWNLSSRSSVPEPEPDITDTFNELQVMLFLKLPALPKVRHACLFLSPLHFPARMAKERPVFCACLCQFLIP